MQETILVLDNNTTLAGLICRTLRNQQIYCEPVSCDIKGSQIDFNRVCGIIIATTNEQNVCIDDIDNEILNCDVPILVLGSMTHELCKKYQGEVLENDIQNETVTLSMNDLPLFSNMDNGERKIHDVKFFNLSEDLECIATATENCIGFKTKDKNIFAMQYSIERNDPDSLQLLKNFATLVCNASPYWSEDFIISNCIEEIRNIAGDSRILCAVSGGVDSAVCAKLAHMAIGDRLVCIFVDTGLFRQDEPQEVINAYMETMGIVVAYEDATDAFIEELKNVSKESEKEEIASKLLRKIILKQINYDDNISSMILGTNFNDILYGETDKTITETNGINICQPLKKIFKHEIRNIAKKLALPDSISERQPFPSSGLALRILGSVTAEQLNTLRIADSFFREEIHANGHEKKLWQYYATISKNPDSQGGEAVVLRASQACNGDACSSRLPYDLLERVTNRIMSELPSVKRVVYDLTPSRHYTLLE